MTFRTSAPSGPAFLPRCLFALLLAGLLAFPPAVHGAWRIKDLVQFEGIRDNILIGYGLVVGLDGSGDSLKNSPFTRQSLESMLERLGVNIRNVPTSTSSVAAVMVTARLPPFARQGSLIDVGISAVGDAGSLQGGTLLATSLLGPDRETYAVAQGLVSVGGHAARGTAASVTRGVPTSGHIPNGAIVERETSFSLDRLDSIALSLRNPDTTTAVRIADAINDVLPDAASAPDPGTVRVTVPSAYRDRVARLIADIEQIQVEPDHLARIIIDESNGIVVIGKETRISTVAIAQGNLTVRITESAAVSQPNPLSAGILATIGESGTGTAPTIQGGGETVVVPQTGITVEEGGADRKLAVLDGGTSLQELVSGLNGLGVGPRDMIAILQAIKAAGALQAEIIVR